MRPERTLGSENEFKPAGEPIIPSTTVPATKKNIKNGKPSPLAADAIEFIVSTMSIHLCIARGVLQVPTSQTQIIIVTESVPQTNEISFFPSAPLTIPARKSRSTVSSFRVGSIGTTFLSPPRK